MKRMGHERAHTPDPGGGEATGAAELIVLTGVDAGKRIALGPGETLVGRAPDVDVQFDPDRELSVSSVHASLSPTGEGWVLRDLGSLNGTLANGNLIADPVLLGDKDQIQFGAGGPVVEFRVGLRGSRPSSMASSGASSLSSRYLWGLIALLSVTLVGVMLAALHAQREGRRYREQVLVMRERIDSILDASQATATALQGRIQGLQDALAESRENLRNVRNSLEAAQEAGDTEEIQALRVRLQEAQAALVRQQLAANLDYDAIEGANRRAVAKVFVDFGDEVVTATAFAVRPDATLMTNRHVVEGSSGTRTPLRVAVQFADSRQVWAARVLATAPADDLAILKVDDIVGDVPTVAGFEATPGSLAAGQAVAVIGFPLGGADPSGEGGQNLARTTLTAGIVSAVGPEILEMNGYGVAGSSGSPVFNNDGAVVGVLFGGRVDAGERTLFAVPASRAAAFLRQVR